jgi:LPXTG-site transpeptidase (sortase) family protein
MITKDREIIQEQRLANQIEENIEQANSENDYFYQDIIEIENEKSSTKNIEENQTEYSQANENQEEYTQENISQEESKKDEEDLLGTLIINKINLIAPIKEGSDEEVLSNYVGHIEETSNYNGNVGLAAHNRSENTAYFSRLNELEIGDKIIYKSEFGTRTYKVSQIKEILDTDWSMLEDTNENKLTLITCINNKVNLRLCVQAEEI